MAPWVHIHTSPIGDVGPCCISKGRFSNSLENNLTGIVNAEGMKMLRQDMLNGVENPACTTCYNHEKQGIKSFRGWMNDRYGEYLYYSLANTRKDGTLDNFKMRYFDVRFNNICNFKCRTCNSSFSSQWEQEDLKRKVPWARVLPRNNKKEFLKEVLDQVPNMDFAYFAGGEPLITEEHYILLEEMIRLGKTNITLKYNSNVSNLKFKDKDILDLWSKFANPIDMSASVDHYGKRAEYIRHGTDWELIEQNLKRLTTVPNINLHINSVVSIFNYASFGEFIFHLHQMGILNEHKGNVLQTYNMVSPEHITAQALPTSVKEVSKYKILDELKKIELPNWQVNQLSSMLNQSIEWVESVNSWEQHKQQFRQEVNEIDLIRNEKFAETFPELESLLHD